MKQLKKLACHIVRDIRVTLPLRTVLVIVLGTATTTFETYNVHRQADITKGGTLGLTLPFNSWLGMSSPMLPPLLNILSYALGSKYLGEEFPKTPIFVTICMVGLSRLWELFPPVSPSLAEYPLTATLMGGCFIGTSCGLAVRQDASCAGDDALALVISKITGCRISRAYPLTDVTVLVFPLSYTPAKRIVYFLIIVTVSSFLIDFIQNFGVGKGDGKDKKEYGIAA